MKIALFSNTDWFMYNFNRSLTDALISLGHEVVLITPPGQFGERLRALGYTWIPAPMDRRSLNPIREIALIVWLRNLFRTQRPDLVHGFTIKCAVYGALAGKLARVKGCVNAVAGLGFVFTNNGFKARVLRPIVRTLMQFVLDDPRSRLILLNRDDLKFFVDQRLAAPERIRLLPGAGVDCTRFVPSTETRMGGELRVLLAARLLWDKGIAEYVQAARKLRNSGRDHIRFLLAGSPDAGNPASVPESIIQTWTEQGLITWLGHVDDMPGLLRTVDVAVLPSYREGLPTGLTEAAACQVAIVTTDAPGCREVVTHEVDGLLVPVRNADSLAEAIARLDDDLPLRKQLGSAARLKALQRFDERIVLEQTIGVYEELIKSTSPQPRIKVNS